ncbi:hypothetical protein, partial [Bifidobacterium breve]|uniref:hypothetical protein n=1 Tax=Bifidobacterium breve TaxID=1685 RepID=UPI00254FAE09
CGVTAQAVIHHYHRSETGITIINVKNFEDKTNIVYWLAYEAMASLCENEHQNILDYLIANKRYNAVAHIVQRFPAESGTYS